MQIANGGYYWVDAGSCTYRSLETIRAANSSVSLGLKVGPDSSVDLEASFFPKLIQYISEQPGAIIKGVMILPDGDAWFAELFFGDRRSEEPPTLRTFFLLPPGAATLDWEGHPGH